MGYRSSRSPIKVSSVAMIRGWANRPITRFPLRCRPFNCIPCMSVLSWRVYLVRIGNLSNFRPKHFEYSACSSCFVSSSALFCRRSSETTLLDSAARLRDPALRLAVAINCFFRAIVVHLDEKLHLAPINIFTRCWHYKVHHTSTQFLTMWLNLKYEVSMDYQFPRLFDWNNTESDVSEYHT